MSDVYSPYKIFAHPEIFENKTNPIITLEIQPTNLCNLNCSFCFYKDYRKKYPVELPFKILDYVLGVLFDFCDDKGIILSGGGEPLMYSHIKELLKTLNIFDRKVGLITNGIKLTQDKELLNLVGETCTWVRISAYPPFNVDFTKVQTYLRSIGVYCQIKILNENELKTPKPAKRFYDNCLITNYIATITATGDVYPCCSSLGDKSMIIGNLNKQSYNQIISSERRKQIIKKINPNRCFPCRYDGYNEILNKIQEGKIHSEFL